MNTDVFSAVSYIRVDGREHQNICIGYQDAPLLSMHPALLRVVLILSNTWLGVKGGKSPNPPPKQEDQERFKAEKVSSDLFTKVAWWYTPLGMVSMHIGSFPSL